MASEAAVIPRALADNTTVGHERPLSSMRRMSGETLVSAVWPCAERTSPGSLCLMPDQRACIEGKLTWQCCRGDADGV